MKPERRDFLKKLVLAGTGMACFPNLVSCDPSKGTDYRIEIGVCTSVSNADLLSHCGYDYIEESVGRFLAPAEDEDTFLRNLEIASKSPIPVKACNGFIPGTMKSVGPDTTHPEILEYAGTAFRRAQQAGVRYIVFGSSGTRRVPEGFRHSNAVDQFVSLIKKMAPIAGEYDVIIVLEPLRRDECNFVNTVAYGSRIVQRVNHPNFMLLADIYHMLEENESADSIINHGPMIKHMHIAEQKNRSMPGTHGEDFTSYFAAMKKAGYKGMVSLEGRWEDMEVQAPVAIEVMRNQMGLV